MYARLANAVKPRSERWRRPEAERTSNDIRVKRNSIDALWESEFLQHVHSAGGILIKSQISGT